ncbi:MAG: hypothetical protein COA79_06475 [Planctomycetota bacterium]|nr:MAG: hypothetical protein COA79_06475 [Planctomycetota bacterium]
MKQHNISFWCSLYLAGLILLFIGCFVKAWVLQVKQFKDHTNYKKKITSSYITIRTPRGKILDQRGDPLALSVRVYSCCMYPQMVSKDADKRQLARTLSRVLHLPFNKTIKKFNSTSKFRWVKRILTKYEEQKIRQLKKDGFGFIDLVAEYKRRYPGSKSLSHVIGYTGVDDQGLAGLELTCNQWLSGKSYKIYMRRDNRGNKILQQLEEPPKQVRTKNVLLTIDSVIQTFTEDALYMMVEKFRPKSAVGLVYNIHNGDVLAMVSYPRFDNNRYKDYNMETMRNRAVNAIYEPGSTFKSFTFAAAFNEGLIKEDEMIDCGPGIWKFGPRTLRDSHACHTISTENVLIKSSNIGTAKIAIKLGEQKLFQYLRDFGFGQKTHLGLTGEEYGIFNHVDKWTNHYSITSIPMGQEINVTPIQLVKAYGALANGGLMMKPRIIKQIVSEDGFVIQDWPPEIEKRVLKVETSKRVLRILKKVVEEGTGKNARSDLYDIGGKTGTSQKIVNGAYSKTQHVGSFIGIAPINNPKIVVLVVLDDPLGKGYGGTVAAPAVKLIIENSLQYLNVPPDKIILSENEIEREQ